jgi:hypothetical protein
MNRGPVDPRLLRYTRDARGHLVVTVALGLTGTALILAQAGLLAHALATAARGDVAAALAGTPTAHLDPAGARLIALALDTELADRTVILISHGRGWSAGGGGRIVRLDHGTLASPTGSWRPTVAAVPR